MCIRLVGPTSFCFLTVMRWICCHHHALYDTLWHNEPKATGQPGKITLYSFYVDLRSRTLLNRNTTNNFRKKLPWAWANQEMEEKCLKFQRLLINCSSSLKSSLANPRAPRYPLPNKANAKLENPVLAPTGIKTLPNWGSRVSAQIHHVGGVCGAYTSIKVLCFAYGFRLLVVFGTLKSGHNRLSHRVTVMELSLKLYICIYT